MVSAVWGKKSIILRSLVIAAVILSISFLSTKVFAEDPAPSWLETEPTLLEDVELRDSSSKHKCTYQMIAIEGSLNPVLRCIVNGKNIHIQDGLGSIAIGNDQKHHKINGLSSSADLIPSTDMLVTRSGFSQFIASGYLSVESNLIESLTPITSSNLTREYSYQHNPDFTLSDGNGPLAIGRGFGHSENGRWLVVEVFGKGLARIDTQNDYKVELFSNFAPAYYVGSNPWMAMTISDDGKYIAFDSTHSPLYIYELSDECTKLIDPNAPFSVETDYQECPKVDLTNVANIPLQSYPEKMEFDDGSFELKYNSGQQAYGPTCDSPDPDIPCYKWYTIRAGGYMPPSLDYLALGDSYSSGEGDTERNPTTDEKYYREYTDNEEDQSQGVPREKCHISTRSYPYILSQGMALGDPLTNSATKWQTVACGGAQIYDANEQNSYGYKGQGKGGAGGSKPRLEGYSNWEAAKTVALNEFIPGRQKQIEFVKKYKPKVITLTMGGNDVGFGDKVEACVWFGTCEYATEDGLPKLAEQMISQYDKLKVFYGQLYEASGRQAKIYVIGYPQFMNSEENVSCGANLGALNAQERKMISKSVELMDNIIEQAARASGVKYIDIEDGLSGGRLCDEGQKYVTGVTNVFGVNGNERQEAFHPNAKGNFEMAMTVWDRVSNESLIDYDICPEVEENICSDTTATKETIAIPAYFESVSDTNSQYTYMTSGRARKTTPLTIMTGPYVLRPASSANVTIHSEPTNLGDFTVADDGSLEQTVQIPSSLPAGYHTLIVTGETYSGEPIELEQVLLVEGADPSDLDENGMPDNEQPCGPFLQSSGEDSDLDGIDDGCDPYIDSAPRPVYRLRAGSSQVEYQGSLEREDYLYLERNVYAGSITGVNGDNDPDGDGYVIIAATQDSVPNGRYAGLQIETDTIPNKVYVNFRTAEDGCVQYRPSDLSRVESSSTYRSFTQHATNTATCRSESVSDDLDNDGQPDDTQPLYVARNGDPSKNETPTKLYLFRSTKAAEAQLGVSDYASLTASAPDSIAVDDSTDYREHWSLLAHTKSNPLLPVTFKKIHVIGATPYVLAATNTGNLCQAYKPQNTATIKQSTQTTNNLVLDIAQTLNAQVGGWCN